MEKFDSVDYYPVVWNEAEDITAEVEDEDVGLELIIQVMEDQYRPPGQIIITDDFSLEDMIPPMDQSYIDQVEEAEQQTLGQMFQEKIP